MKYFILLLTFSPLTGLGQAEEGAVKQTIVAFFDGMRKGDSTLIKSTVSPTAILQTVYKDKEGKVGVRSDDMGKFITAVSRPHPEVLDEQVTFDVVRVDADLAIAWTPYRFYIGKKFSHCGVNSFQLVRIEGKWKIQYIIDTRRKDDCK
jgi:hypothetical protein